MVQIETLVDPNAELGTYVACCCCIGIKHVGAAVVCTLQDSTRAVVAIAYPPSLGYCRQLALVPPTCWFLNTKNKHVAHVRRARDHQIRLRAIGFTVARHVPAFFFAAATPRAINTTNMTPKNAPTPTKIM